MFLASFRTSVAIVALFFFLDLTFMFLMIGEYTEHITYTKTGGGLGIVTAAIAYYAAASGLMSPESSYFALPAGDLPKHHATSNKYYKAFSDGLYGVGDAFSSVFTWRDNPCVSFCP